MYLNIKGQYERYYYCHIRKCGGTSINRIFLNAFDNESGFLFGEINKGNIIYYDGLLFAGHTQEYLREGRFLYAFSHTPLHKVRLPEHTFTFTTFRDPASRIISHYRNILRWKDNFDDNVDRARELKWLGNSFMDFLDNIPKEHLLRQIYMFSPTFNVDEAYARIRELNAYFFVEDMDLSLKILSSLFNTPFRNCNHNKGTQDINLTPKESVRLRSILKDEYILTKRLRLGYNTLVFPEQANASGI